MSDFLAPIKKKVINRFFIAFNVSILLTFLVCSCKAEFPVDSESNHNSMDSTELLKVTPLPILSTDSVSSEKSGLSDIKTPDVINTSTVVPSPETSPTSSLPEPGELIIVGIDKEGAVEWDNSIGYDSLQICMNLNVGEAGTYIVNATLSTLDGQVISFGNLIRGGGVTNALASTSMKCDKGLNNRFVYFGGSAIRNSKKNGPYKVNITIYNTSKKKLDSIEYETKKYDYKQFN
ncbi:MAG TPA: hypothetical protein PKY26_04850 [Acetivibrio clariflavus]|nr:hypothetical protein [Acetivibrio clariflavus]